MTTEIELPEVPLAFQERADVIRIKSKDEPGGPAIVTYTQPSMLYATVVAAQLWQEYGQILVITSGTDGVHKRGSLHYPGKALDYRVRYFDEATRRKVANILQYRLGQSYDVILKSTHMHVEHDPKHWH